jgi:hypothetical protein
MILRGFVEAYERFKKDIISADPSLEQKLDDSGWQKANKRNVDELSGFIGAALIEHDISGEGTSLVLKVVDYSGSCFLDEGNVLRSTPKSGKLDRTKLPKRYIDRYSFWDPILVEQHLEVLRTHIPLESLMKGEDNFAAKIEKIHEDKWTKFLNKNGFAWSRGSEPDFESLSVRKKVLVSQEAVDRTNSAYDMIIAKENGVAATRAEFDAKFPDFAERFWELNRDASYEKFYMNGFSTGKEFEKRGFLDMRQNLERGDIVVADADANRMLAFKEELKGAEFLLYKDLKEAYPEIEEKMRYIKGTSATLGKSSLVNISFEGTKGMTEMEWRKKRYGGRRMRDAVQFPSRKTYDTRIVRTVDALYNLLQVTDRVYGMIEESKDKSALWSLINGVAPEEHKYWAKDPYIRNGLNYGKGNLLMLIERTADGDYSVNDAISGAAESYKIDRYWFDRLGKHSQTEEIRRDGVRKMIISERQVGFFSGRLRDLQKMVNTAINSLYKQPA